MQQPVQASDITIWPQTPFIGEMTAKNLVAMTVRNIGAKQIVSQKVIEKRIERERATAHLSILNEQAELEKATADLDAAIEQAKRVRPTELPAHIDGIID